MVKRNKRIPATPMTGGRKGQAAIFDGIMFLLLASISVTMVFSSLGSYGVAQDDVLRSSYQIAYIESVTKALYYLDAPTLAQAVSQPAIANYVDNDYCDLHPGLCSIVGSGPLVGEGNSPTGVGEPYWDLANNPTINCTLLANFPQETVADLLKKDLGDATDSGSGPTVDENTICLDNRFGVDAACTTAGASPVSPSTPGSAATVPPLVPGKLALRCALVELMTPFHSAGYRYFADVLKETSNTVVPQQYPSPGSPPSGGPEGWPRITDSYVADAGDATTGGPYESCEDVSNYYGPDTTPSIPGTPGNTAQVNLLTVATPFRIPRSDTIQQFFAQTLRICVWKSQLG
jgi:hypothetical protein